MPPVKVSQEADSSIGVCPVAGCSSGLPVLSCLLIDRYNAFNRFVEMAESDEEQAKAFQETDAELLAVLAVIPGDWSALRLRGELLMVLERHNDAAECFKRAFNAHCNFVRISEQQKNPSRRVGGKRAQENLNRLFESDPGTVFLIDAIDWDLIEAKRGSFTDLNLCVELSRALTKLGQTDEAGELLCIVDRITQRSALLQDVEKQSLSYDTLVARGECCIELGEWDKAETFLEKAVLRRQFQAGLGILMARCLLGKGERKAAIRYMALAYFYEEPWREDRRRATLKYWRELQAETQLVLTVLPWEQSVVLN